VTVFATLGISFVV